MRPRMWFTDLKHKDGLLLLVSLALMLLAVLLAYQRDRRLGLNVGDVGDTPFLSGFYADELDIGYRYRWSTAHSEVSFIGAGSAGPAFVLLRAQGPGVQLSARPITMSVSMNGVTLYPPVVTSTQALKDYDFEFVRDESTPPPREIKIPPGPLTLSIDTSTFKPPGDARNLGVKVDRVELWQDGADMNLPPLWMVIWPLVLVVGLYGLAQFLRQPFASIVAFVLGLLGALLFLVLHTANQLYVAAYLPPVAAVVGIAGLLVWQRHRFWRWPQAVDALGRVRIASIAMLGAMLLYAIFALWVIPNVDYIGHADYAENAVIARNFVEGRDLTVDYVAQFYKDYPGITHPAETWPLLQPMLIAPFFAVFGPQTWVAKLPNLVVLLLLAWAVFGVASRLWDSRVGLLAGMLTLLHPYFFNSVLYPINDLAFTLIFFVLAWLVWRQLAPPGSVETVPASERPPSVCRSNVWAFLFIGALAGLLMLGKPSGAALLVGLGLWTIWTWRRVYLPRKTKLPVRDVLFAGGAAALVLLPLVTRNLLAFGQPFFSTESYDAWILRYWPLHNWEDIYKVYVGGELPHPRWIVGGKFGYENLFSAVGYNFGWVWQKGVMNPESGDFVIGLLPLSGALVGLTALTRRVASLFGMVGLSIGLYALFVLLYWHFEGRYFQVAVPWLYMLLAWGVFWLWDHLRAALREGMARRWGLFLLPIAVAALLWPSISAIAQQTHDDTTPTGFVADMQWLAAHSTPQDVVMTRDPWEVNWHTSRKAVMIPNHDLRTIERIAHQYGATMLQLGGPVDNVRGDCPNPTVIRPALDGLYCGIERPGYKLVYKDGDLTIYRLK